MKKIICLSLIMCLLFTTVVFGQENDFADEGNYKEDLLYVLGIVDSNGNEEYVTRAEFAQMVYNLVNMDDMGLRIETISDMHREHPDMVYVSNIVGVGWMTLDENNCFRPDEKMPGIHMLKVLISALGYYDIAMKEGGYPTGILNYATKVKLTKGVTADFSSVLSRSQTYALLRNSLNVDMMEREYFSGGEYYNIVKGMTILSENHHITEHEAGRYIANHRFNFDITGTLTPENTVKIGDTIFYVGEYADKIIPGGYYKVYSSYENESDLFETIRFVVESNNTKIVCVETSDIMDSTTISEFVYNEERNNKYYEKKVDLNNIDVIYNGEELFTYRKEDLMPAVGEVCLVFEGGACTTVVISSYITKIVKNISSEYEKIYFDYSGGAIDYSEEDFNIYFEGAVIKPEDLQSMDVALVQYAKSGFVNKMLITRGYSEGVISVIDSKGYYCIENIEYKLSPQIYDFDVEFGVGSKILFYLDAYGDIAYIKKTDVGNYAFLVGGMKQSGISDDFELKLLTADGTIGIYKVDDKTKFNNSRIGAEQILNSLLKENGGLENQLLKIKYNSSNVLKSIETAIDNESGKYIEAFSKDLTTDSKQWRYYNQFLSNGNNIYYLKSDTLVFSVFVDENGEISEDSLLVSDVGTEFINFKTYDDVVLYDIDEIENAPKVIVNYLSAKKNVSTVTGQRGLIVIDSIGRTMTADGDEVDNIIYYLNGVLQEIAVSENVKNVAALDSTTYDVPDVYDNVTFSDLQSGDAIQINIDHKGQVSSFIPAFVQSVLTEYGTLIDYNNQGYAQFSNYETVYGKLEEQTENVLRINVNGESKLFIHGTPVVYLYEKGRNKVSLISSDELYNYTDCPMFFHSYRKTVSNIIVYLN